VFLYEQPNKDFVIQNEFFQQYFKNLTVSVDNRIGFNLTQFTQTSNLGNPLAANYFLVTTPNNSSTTTAGTSTAATSTPASASGASGSVFPTSTQTATNGASSMGASRTVGLGIVVAALIGAM
jgi:hypothetical protein